MLKSQRLFALTLLLSALAPRSSAQFKVPAETRNAALRYWQAFAEMQDPPAEPPTALLLGKTAVGELPWDEAKLGPILDANESAIRRMQRATKLPECDWGIDYSEGPDASIAYATKARVMGRLNSLYGVRQAAKGNESAALQTWLDGIRFSQDVAKGGPLIAILIAKASLVSDLHLITQAVQSGKLSRAERQQVTQVVNGLPDSTFDWSIAEALEEDSLDLYLERLEKSQNPANSYAAIWGHDPPAHLVFPSSADRAAFHKFMVNVAEAYRLPPDQTQTKLPALQEALKSLNPFFRELIPSLTRMNDARKEIAASRQQLLRALAEK
jgi:hypothetical protein